MTLRTKRLSIVDQTLSRHYVRVCLCFPFSSAGDVSAATIQIKSGLLTTLRQFPYLAGTVRTTQAQPTDGSVTLSFSDQVEDVHEPLFVVKMQLSLEDPCYDDLVQTGIPPAAIPRSRFGALPDHPNLEDPSPVLGVCVSFIRGGLVLTLYSQHSVIDGRGLGYFIEELAANVRASDEAQDTYTWSDCNLLLCPPDGLRRYLHMRDVRAKEKSILHGLEKDDEARDQINTYATDISPRLANAVCPEFQSSNVIPPPLSSAPQAIPKANVFVFNAAALRQLRDSVARFWHSADDPGRFPRTEKVPVFPNIIISTWDALASLIWIHVTRSRFSEDESRNLMTRFGFTIDCRKRLSFALPDRFMGNAALYTYAEFPMSEFTKPGSLPFELFARVALHIRFTNMHFTKTAVDDRLAYFAKQRLLQPPGNAINSTFGPDVFMTSWQDMGGSANFGIQGTLDQPAHSLRSYEPGMPTFIRKPGCVPTDGGIILLPRRKLSNQPDDAPFEVVVQLRNGNMDRLIKDAGFMSYIQRVIT